MRTLSIEKYGMLMKMKFMAIIINCNRHSKKIPLMSIKNTLYIVHWSQFPIKCPYTKIQLSE